MPKQTAYAYPGKSHRLRISGSTHSTNSYSTLQKEFFCCTEKTFEKGTWLSCSTFFSFRHSFIQFVSFQSVTLYLALLSIFFFVICSTPPSKADCNGCCCCCYCFCVAMVKFLAIVANNNKRMKNKWERHQRSSFIYF